jgi:hypothetical protein
MSRLVETPFVIGVFISMFDSDLSDDEERRRIFWADRNPTFGRTLHTLFWKTILLKIRHPAAIVEFILACVIIFPKRDDNGSPNPPLVSPKDKFTQNLLKAMAIYPDSKLVLFPESQ